MKCAIIADTILINNNNNYYSMTLTYEFLSKRYLCYYDEIILMTRVELNSKKEGNTSGYKIVNGKNIIVKPIKNYRYVPDAIKNLKVISKQMDTEFNDCDVIIIRLPNVLGLIACSICRKKHYKYYVEMLACPFDSYWYHHNRFGKILAPIMYFLNRKAIKESPKVLYVTNEFLQTKYPTKGESISCSDVVLNEIDNKIIQNRKKRINEYNENRELKIVTIGNVGLKIKGQKYVIKALSLLKNKNIKYYLIGSGKNNYLKKIAKKYNVEDKIVFIGSIPHNQIFNKLTEMDLYIQPSLQEGMPRSLLEAMSVGLPSIGTKTGGIPELLKPEYMFKKKNYKSISKILNNINSSFLEENMNYITKKITDFSDINLKRKRDIFYK